MTQTDKANAHILVISDNRRARHNYAVEDTLECGIVLSGTEVKSLRLRHVNFSDAYAFIKNGELFLIGLKIEPFLQGSYNNHEAERTRKLLAHEKEITRLQKEVREKGYTLVPLKIYFKNGRVKVLIGTAKGRKDFDKREQIKDRDVKRQISRVLRRG